MINYTIRYMNGDEESATCKHLYYLDALITKRALKVFGIKYIVASSDDGNEVRTWDRKDGWQSIVEGGKCVWF